LKSDTAALQEHFGVDNDLEGEMLDELGLPDQLRKRNREHELLDKVFFLVS